MRQIRRIGDFLNVVFLRVDWAALEPRRVELFGVEAAGYEIVILKSRSHGCDPARTHFVVRVAKSESLTVRNAGSGVAHVRGSLLLCSSNSSESRQTIFKGLRDDVGVILRTVVSDNDFPRLRPSLVDQGFKLHTNSFLAVVARNDHT